MVNNHTTVIARWGAIKRDFTIFMYIWIFFEADRRFALFFLKGTINLTGHKKEERIMAIFKGAGVAIVTPFNEDLSVN